MPDRQQVAIDLILAGATDMAIAETLGLSRKTLYRWRHNDPLFRHHLEVRRRELRESSVDRLAAMLAGSLDALERQIRDPNAATALRAARAILVLARLGDALVSPVHAPG